MLEIHLHQTQSMETVDTLNLIERVRTECRDHPEVVAIESGSCHVTYAELRNQADSIGALKSSVLSELFLGGKKT